MLDWIKFVVVAFRTIKRQAEERFADMLDRFIHPLVAIEQEKVSRQIAGRHESISVIGMQLVTG